MLSGVYNDREAGMLKKLTVWAVVIMFFVSVSPVFAADEAKSGPTPSKNAYEHANQNAKFMRTGDLKEKDAQKASKDAEKEAAKAKKEVERKAEKAKKEAEKTKKTAEKEAKNKQKEMQKQGKKMQKNLGK